MKSITIAGLLLCALFICSNAGAQNIDSTSVKSKKSIFGFLKKKKDKQADERAIVIEPAPDLEQIQALEEVNQEILQELSSGDSKEARKLRKQMEEDSVKNTVILADTISESTEDGVAPRKIKFPEIEALKMMRRRSMEIEPAQALRTKDQKKPKVDLKLDKGQLAEYPAYAERIGTDPENADIRIFLPVAKKEDQDAVRIEKAVELINNHFPDKALVILKQLLFHHPENHNYNYWMGRAYFDSYTGREKALSYFKKATEKTDFDYKFNKVSANVKAPINSLFYLAWAYHLDGDLNYARRTYQIYQGIAKSSDPFKKEAGIRLQQIDSFESQKELKKSDVKIKHTGKINSLYDDFRPLLTNDGTELFYSSNRPPQVVYKAPVNLQNGTFYSDIYVSTISGAGILSAPETFELNTVDDDIISSISPNAKILTIYREGENYKDYFESSFAFNSWQAAIEMVSSNTNKWGKHFTTSASGDKIYFASNQLGGFGGFDLFETTRQDDGSWTEPINLGEKINSLYNENMPFLHPNGNALFFSSDGPSSIGGYDIMRSNYTGTWEIPENMGMPINTPGDDLYFSLAYDGKTAWYAKQAPDGLGGLDIYQISFTSGKYQENARIQASFNLDVDNLDKSTEVIVTNVKSRDKKSYRPNVRTGKFNISVEPCAVYILSYSKDGVIIRSEEVTAPCPEQN